MSTRKGGASHICWECGGKTSHPKYLFRSLLCPICFNKGEEDSVEAIWGMGDGKWKYREYSGTAKEMIHYYSKVNLKQLRSHYMLVYGGIIDDIHPRASSPVQYCTLLGTSIKRTEQLIVSCIDDSQRMYRAVPVFIF
jgi:hypothetical protein